MNCSRIYRQIQWGIAEFAIQLFNIFAIQVEISDEIASEFDTVMDVILFLEADLIADYLEMNALPD